MGDLLPPQAAERRSLARTLLHTFELYGYNLVTAPAFEHAEVIERGSDATDRRDLLRFVDPDSGEVAVLRPDITPQVARIVASRLQLAPRPIRLCYDGRVIRRRRGRARRHKQISQVGVELVGWPGTEADNEVIALAYSACHTAGLRNFRIELSHVSVAHAALSAVPENVRPHIADALARKDIAVIDDLARRAKMTSTARRRIAAIAELRGSVDTLQRAERALAGWPQVSANLRELRAVVVDLQKQGIANQIGIDLSETRGSSYYTGVSFSILAEGPGEPLGGGGRYDNLIGRFGASAPATGFAIDVDNLQWALRHAGVKLEGSNLTRVAVAGTDARSTRLVCTSLRAAGVGVAAVPDADAQAALAFARAWSYAGALIVSRGAVHGVRARDGERRKFGQPGAVDATALSQWLETPLGG